MGAPAHTQCESRVPVAPQGSGGRPTVSREVRGGRALRVRFEAGEVRRMLKERPAGPNAGDVALGRRCGHWAAQYRGFTEGHASAKIRYRGPHFTYTVFSLFLPDLCHVPRDMMLNRVRAIRAVRAKSDAPPTPHPDDSHASATRLMLVWVTREAASLARRKWQPGWHQRPARAARRFRPRAQCPAHSRAGPSCCGDLLDVGLACFAGAVSPTTSDTR